MPPRALSSLLRSSEAVVEETGGAAGVAAFWPLASTSHIPRRFLLAGAGAGLGERLRERLREPLRSLLERFSFFSRFSFLRFLRSSRESSLSSLLAIAVD